MLLVLSEEHKEHLSFLTKVDVEGKCRLPLLLGARWLLFFLCSGEGVLQDISGVY